MINQNALDVLEKTQGAKVVNIWAHDTHKTDNKKGTPFNFENRRKLLKRTMTRDNTDKTDGFRKKGCFL
jgi:hypothetical protein